MDRLRELARLGQVGGLGLHPQQVRERRRGQGFRDRIGDTAANLVVTLRGLGPLAVPGHVHAEFGCPARSGIQRRGLGEIGPLGRLHRQRLALALLELQHLTDGIAVGLQTGIVLPGVDEL